jgi:hypothetical protein
LIRLDYLQSVTWPPLGSSPVDIQTAVIAHSEVARHEVPRNYTARVYMLGGIGHALVFDPEIPPYDLTNLVFWLADPKICPGTTGTVGWLTSVATGIRYHLAPNTVQKGDDTILGIGADGSRVEVFLPDCSVTVRKHGLKPTPEPKFNPVELTPAVEFRVELDASQDFGNPEFLVG